MLSRFFSSKIVLLALLAIVLVEFVVCQRPKAVHLDVEPAALPGGAEGNAANFLSLLRKVKQVTNGKTKLVADVPMGMGPAPLGAWKYDGRPISEHVTDIVDVVSLMAYRDRAAAPDGILDHSRDFLSYAKKVGKKVTVGVEVTCESGLPNKATFCEEGDAYMERQLNDVVSKLSYEYGKTFDGIVVHQYNSYSTKPFASSSVSRSNCRAMWVWDHKVVHDTTARNTFLEFARSRKVCTVYMDCYGLVDRSDNRPKLTSFINAAYDAGIKVELLIGGNDWVYPQNHNALVSLVQTTVNYIVNFPTNARRAVNEIEILEAETPSNNSTKVL